MSTVNDFAERLAYSHAQSDQPWWDDIYRRAFPDLVHTIDLRHDGWHQKAGRDRAVILSNGKTIYVDEKAREDDYGDIFVEVWSVYPKGCKGSGYPPVAGAVPGWACKPLDCDYLAYAIVPQRTCYLYPFQGIRSAWELYGNLWRGHAQCRRHGYCWRAAANARYDSIGICMPPDALWDSVKDALTLKWEGTPT